GRSPSPSSRTSSSGTSRGGRRVTHRGGGRSRGSSWAHFQLPDATDQAVRRAVVTERWLCLALELRNDALGQRLAELDAPLIERVDLPDGASRDVVLVQSD